MTEENKAHLPFRMSVRELFVIPKRGIVVVGNIESGSVRVGDSILIWGKDKTITTKVAGIEMPNFLSMDKLLEYIKSNEAGILIKDVSREDLEIGMIITPV